MDSITQAALGAAIGEATLGTKIGRKGALIGAVVATIPDLDVLLTPFFDELQKVSIHRGYSHSILFCLIAAFILMALMNRWKWMQGISNQRLWWFNFLVLITHVLLDAFTTYGTQVFLPFTDLRVSFDSINIVDPVYTLPLLIGVGISIFYFSKSDTKRGLPNKIGLILSSLYLIFTLINKQHIEGLFSKQLESQKISYFEMLSVPVKVGNLIWYGVVKDSTHLHIGKYSMLEQNNIEFHSFPINEHLLEDLDSTLVDRMKWFAQDFYVVAEHDGKTRIYNMQCDMQGVRTFGSNKAPTAFYYEVTSNGDKYDLTVGMQESQVSR